MSNSVLYQTQSSGQAPEPEQQGLPTLPSESYVPQAMPGALSTFDLTVLFALALFWISNVTGTVIGGTSAFTFWIFGTVAFFVPCCIVCAQLGRIYPHEGSIYNWTYNAFALYKRPGLANFMSFFIGICAWLPGLLSIVSAADVIVSCLQALNPNWLPLIWQQGLVIIAICVLSGIISAMNTRTVMRFIVGGFFTTGLAVCLLGIAALMWLLKGHPSATNFADPQAWQVSFDPATGNIFLLGTVTLALLGATGPLMMSGEINAKERGKAIPRHLLWGGILVIFAYFVTTWALLVVQGQNAALNTGNPVQLVFATAEGGLGKIGADIVAVCVMFFFIVVAVIYNVMFARLLMTAGIDQRLPIRIALINRNRVPVNAVILQTVLAVVVTLIIFFGLPSFSFLGLGNASDLTSKAYLVTAAALLLIWAFSFLFPFIDLGILILKGSKILGASTRILPTPVLLVCIVAGSFVCIATIVDTLLFSFAPALIPNNNWSLMVGIFA
ncbi:MAG TPA: amino acid permease, partial [Ktedonobacteraceae bacterium]|nr:amino acid permease [Ktedonobacteraceae bacterium]